MAVQQTVLRTQVGALPNHLLPVPFVCASSHRLQHQRTAQYVLPSQLSHRCFAPLRGDAVVVQAMKGFGIGVQKAAADKKCPCGSGSDYSACCQRYHKSVTVKAPSAEDVLRARFSAYAKREYKYIVRTTHLDSPAQRGSMSPDGKVRTTFEEDIKVSMFNFDFVKLTILGSQPGNSDKECVIDMQVDVLQKIDEKAKKLAKPIPQTICEKSLFVLDEDEWKFLKALDSNWSREELKVVT